MTYGESSVRWLPERKGSEGQVMRLQGYCCITPWPMVIGKIIDAQLICVATLNVLRESGNRLCRFWQEIVWRI